MSLNRQNVREILKEFRFDDLFIEELGWNTIRQQPISIKVDNCQYTLEAIAEKRGMITYHCLPNNGKLPDYSTRRKIDNEITKYTREHFIIYSDSNKQTQVWQWVRREIGKPQASRQYRYDVSQSGEVLIQKLEAIAIDIEEEEKLTLADVTRKARKAFDVDKVTKKFFDCFKKEHGKFFDLIQGINSNFDKEWYASLVLNRLMFIYFIQKKGFLDGDTNYLQNRLEQCKAQQGKDEFYSFYRYFLLRLFHDGLGSQNRTEELEKLLGRVPYLNGGLFEVHQIEKNYPNIQISDSAFESIFNFFDQYHWHLDDRPLRNDNEVNPDVLGYIFEKYINQKQMGAYYTKEDITEYISKNCIIPYLFDATAQAYPEALGPDSPVWKLLADDPNRYIYEAVQKGVDLELPEAIAVGINDVSQRTRWNEPADENFALPTEIWREHIARRQRCLEIREKLTNGEVTQINDLITYNLNIRQFSQDAIANCEDPKLTWEFYKTLSQMSVLDPTCGSGAFLFAALNILDALYDACLERMQSFLADGQAGDYKTNFEQLLNHVENHHNRRYFILKSIIINNLYGVDIMEEATEICKLRLFLKLAAQVEPDEYEDNYGIEPLPDIDFNIRAGNTLVGFASYEDVKKAVEGDQQMKIDLFRDMDSIDQKAQSVDKIFQEFRNLQTQNNTDGEVIAATKKALRDSLDELREELDRYLADEYKRGQSKNSQKFQKWKENHQPFHWFVEFYGIINKGGFDVIIGNPPYVVYTKIKDYSVRSYKTELCKNIYAFTVERVINLCNSRKRISMIIPSSAWGVPGTENLRDLILSNIDSLYVSYFSGDAHPSVLFEGVKLRLSIFIAHNENKYNPKIYTSKYLRWFAKEREILFSSLHYTDIIPKIVKTIPKVGSPLEKEILVKLNNIQNSSIEKYLENNIKNRKYCLYYHNAPVFYIRAMNFVPYYNSESSLGSSSSHLKTLYVNKEDLVNPIIAILNSSLFFIWFTNYSANRDLTYFDLMYFPVLIPDADDKHSFYEEITFLVNELMEDFRKNSVIREYNYESGKLSYQEFYVKKSKRIIDKIDRLLAKYYNFTKEEIDFIINYDIKYRMDKDLLEED